MELPKLVAEFYLVDASFQYQEGVTIPHLVERLQSLAEDCNYIRENKHTNKQLRYTAIYETEIFPNITVLDFLYNPLITKEKFERDTVNALQMIIDRAEETNLSNSEIVTRLDKHNESIAYGLLCLHPIAKLGDITINKEYLVYNKQNWLAFRRSFLGIYPQNSAFFHEEAKSYFPNLYLHDSIIDTMRPIYNNFVKKIIYHLSCLNDDFHKYKQDPYQRIETLNAFSSLLDEQASPQGNANVKPLLTFDFTTGNGMIEAVCCEPHLKLCYSDNHPGDSKYYYYRIYFHEGKKHIQNGKILIGHIGEHL